MLYARELKEERTNTKSEIDFFPQNDMTKSSVRQVPLPLISQLLIKYRRGRLINGLRDISRKHIGLERHRRKARSSCKHQKLFVLSWPVT
jgi:hypothetical protein